MLGKCIMIELSSHRVGKRNNTRGCLPFLFKVSRVDRVDHSQETKEKSVRYLLRGTGSLYTDLLSQVLRGIKGSRWSWTLEGGDEFWNLFSSTCHFVPRLRPNFSRTREKKEMRPIIHPSIIHPAVEISEWTNEIFFFFFLSKKNKNWTLSPNCDSRRFNFSQRRWFFFDV